MHQKFFRILSVVAALFFITSAIHSVEPFELNQKLGRGVNLGNALDAPQEGEWGLTLRSELFDMIKEAGFDSVRIPVRWESHAMTEPPYTIDEEWFTRVEWAVGQALARGLPVVMDMHHYRQIYADPSDYHRERLMAFWEQIAPRFAHYSHDLVLELFNEPDENFTPELWNEWLIEALAVVRKTNPDRVVMIGPGEDNITEYLSQLELPEDDRNIIVTVHNYHPLTFTHQGAEWLTWADTSEWLGNTWGTEEEMAALLEEMDMAAAWGKKHNRPMNLGEFGAIRMADMESRARWTKALADAAIERGMSFHYWEFCAHWFGVWDDELQQYNEPLLRALIPLD